MSEVVVISFVVGLAVVATALTFERLYLRRQRVRLSRLEQSCKFHSLRDDLQFLAIEGQLDPKSPLYAFLMTMLNLAIRNGATFRASEMIRISNQMDRMIPPPNENMISEVRLYNHEVQHFVAVCFYEFSRMLMLNDPIFAFGRVAASAARISWRKLLDSSYVVEPHPLLRSLFPHSAQTLERAAAYRAISDNLRAHAA